MTKQNNGYHRFSVSAFASRDNTRQAPSEQRISAFFFLINRILPELLGDSFVGLDPAVPGHHGHLVDDVDESQCVSQILATEYNIKPFSMLHKTFYEGANILIMFSEVYQVIFFWGGGGVKDGSPT